MNTSAILDETILDGNIPVLQPIPKVIAKSMQKVKDLGNWSLDYIPLKSKVVDEALESFKNIIKKLYNKRDFIPIERVKMCVEEICDAVSNRRKRWV